MIRRHRCKIATAGPDPVIADARRRQAIAVRQRRTAESQLRRVDERRREAADLLAESREAERRNHFAEAIAQSMGRNR
jgi:hypothetical protein